MLNKSICRIASNSNSIVRIKMENCAQNEVPNGAESHKKETSATCDSSLPPKKIRRRRRKEMLNRINTNNLNVLRTMHSIKIGTKYGVCYVYNTMFVYVSLCDHSHKIQAIVMRGVLVCSMCMRCCCCRFFFLFEFFYSHFPCHFFDCILFIRFMKTPICNDYIVITQAPCYFMHCLSIPRSGYSLEYNMCVPFTHKDPTTTTTKKYHRYTTLSSLVFVLSAGTTQITSAREDFDELTMNST